MITSVLNDIRTAVHTALGSNQYWSVAPINADYPYKVCDLSAGIVDETGTTYTMTVDYWYRGSSYSDVINAAADDAYGTAALNKKRAVLTNGFAMFNLDSMITVSDKDASLRRVRATYTIRAYQSI